MSVGGMSREVNEASSLSALSLISGQAVKALLIALITAFS